MTEQQNEPGEGPVGLAGAVEAALTLALIRRARARHPSRVVVYRRGDVCFLADGDIAVAGRTGIALLRQGADLGGFPSSDLDGVLGRLGDAGHLVALVDREA